MKITVDSVTVNVWSSRTRGYEEHVISWKEAGVTKRRKFANFEAAKKEAWDLANRIANGTAKQLTPADVASYHRAREVAAETGKPLEIVALEYARETKKLGSVSLEVAVDYYLSHHHAGEPKQPGEILPEMIEEKRQDELSDIYLYGLENRLSKFTKAYRVPLVTITGQEIDDWIRSLKNGSRPLGSRSRQNYRTAISTLVSFAKLKRYLPSDWPEMSYVPDYRAKKKKPVHVFTPSEMQRLLNAAEPHQLPFLSIAGFAGVRHYEIKRLTWDDINLEQRFIRVESGKAKTASRRLVPIQDNLFKILTRVKGLGPICTYSNMSEEMLWLAQKAGVKWRHNAPRHSFCTYRLAITHDDAKTAYEAGNSPAVIHRDYDAMATPEEATKWFSLLPNPDSIPTKTQNLPKPQ